ncbi:hypothetical protein D9M71_756330 [compost metagenome]
MPELSKNHPACGMHGFCNLTPAFDLLCTMDSRGPCVTLTAGLDLGTFCHHETGTGALAVVSSHEVIRDVARLRAAAASQWRQDDPVFQSERAQLSILEEYRVFHFMSPIYLE